MNALMEKIKVWFIKPDDWLWDNDDPWVRVFEVANSATTWQMPDMEVSHNDIVLSLYSDNADQLIQRLGMLYKNVRDNELSDYAYGERRRELKDIFINDYIYSEKVGYRSLQEVLELVLNKLAVIHNLFESVSMNEDHEYYQYMIREYKGIISDCLVVLEKFYEIRLQ